jgi:membrane-bound hydrogenase subunit beta
MANDEFMKSLEAKLIGVVFNMTAPRERRIFAETTSEKLVEATRLLKECGMINIGTITGLDSGDRFEVIYHFYNSQGLLFNLKVFIARNQPKIPSVTSVFPGVFLYERELMDLLGIIVEGTPPSRRYPLPDNWPEGQYPLRKDWKGPATEIEVKIHE